MLTQLHASAAIASAARASGGANGTAAAYANVSNAAVQSNGSSVRKAHASRFGHVSSNAAMSAAIPHGSSEPSVIRATYQRHTGQKHSTCAARTSAGSRRGDSLRT
jgi:hypothetical protein